MAAHGSGGLDRIAAFNGADDVVVIVAVGVEAVGIARPVTQVAPCGVQTDRIEHFEDVQHQSITRRFGNGAVQGAVPQLDAFGIGLFGDLLASSALGKAAQNRHLLTIGPYRGQ